MSTIEPESRSAEHLAGVYGSAPEASRASGSLIAAWEVRRLAALGRVGTLAVPGSKTRYLLSDVLAVAEASKRPATAARTVNPER